MTKQLLFAAAFAMVGGAALAQDANPTLSDRQLSGPTIQQKQGVDPYSVESRSPTFWNDPSRQAPATTVRTYTNPSASSQSAQAPTPSAADVDFIGEPAALNPVALNNDDSQTTPAPAFTAPTPVAADVAVMTTEMVSSAPVPDTAENRRMYGQPMSGAGKRTAPRGN